ncbi:MAG: MmgE/PrpD family protein [Kiloniellales bacterium]|nr:MmgE/PrpD family protein [Kiloniellales bacterium]
MADESGPSRPPSVPRPGPTKALAGWVAGAATAAFDAASLRRARGHTIDTVGAMLAGAVQEATDTAARTLRLCGVSGGTPVPGRRERLDLLSAAFLGGTAGHGLELDDGHRAGSVHPGTVVVPAALAAAHHARCDGRTFLAAVIAGYEVMCRLAAASHPRARWRGFHNTATTGVFGAAAVWAVMHRFDAARVEHAFGAACSSASGLFTFLQGGDVKRLHPGLAARSGLMAAVLAGEGLEGPPDCLEGKDGYFHAYAGGDTGEVDYAGIDLLPAGAPPAVTECYIKPHACCRHIHAPIDALLQIMAEHDLAAGAIAAIRVGTYRVAAAHDLRAWPSFTAAQMSIPFVLATAARHRRVGLDLFTAGHRADRATALLAERVAVGVDPACETAYPAHRPAAVTLETADGRRLTCRVDEPYGAPANPLDDDALEAKMRALAGPVLGEAGAREIAGRLWEIEREEDLRPLVESLALPAVT